MTKSLVIECSRYGVIAAATPRVAGEDALEGKPTALEETVFLDGLDAVVGAGGRIATALPDERGQSHLIDADQQNEELSRQIEDELHGW